MPLSAFLEVVRDAPKVAPEVFDRAREANHRIANNLALLASCVRLQAGHISQQASGFTTDAVRLLLAETAARIDAVGRLHRKLSSSPAGEIDLSEYLAEMCATLKPFVSASGPVELFCDFPRGCVVRPHQLVPIALIVSEMLTNAIKYAHPAGAPGRIDVGCRRQGDKLLIEVCDNGVGLPDGFNVERDGGLGFKIVRTLTNQLGATPVFDSDALGLRFLLVLPNGD